jgi:hypothetical protein
MVPFILVGRSKLPPEPAPSALEQYDPIRQLWIETDTGEPLVNRLRSQARASQYGETTITETREGADQAETTLQASPYGETIMTKTHEGVDQTEASSWRASSYGETIQTATREGIDQPEGSLDASTYGETIETRTAEGMDQTEISSSMIFGSGSAQLRRQESALNPEAVNSPSPLYAPHPHF